MTSPPPMNPTGHPALRIDLHAHLAGVGTQGSGCWISESFRRRIVFRYLRLRFGITAAQMAESVDQDWAARLAARVRESELDRAVALGFDGVYDAGGRLDEGRSQMVVPEGWVFEACRRHPELLPGPSINPLRRDALEALDESIRQGAVLIKWLPSAQGMDPADRRLAPFYRRLADHRVPLLVHAGGGENTFAEVAPELNDVELLLAPLEAGVTVICAHMGAPVTFHRRPDQTPRLRSMLERYPHLRVDNSGMANPSRFPSLARLADDPVFLERVLYGSDYPIPANAIYYLRRLGMRRVRELERVSNPLDRDIRIKRALGYPDDSLTRASALLPLRSHR